MTRLLQRFHEKDVSKSVNAKKAERKTWEENYVTKKDNEGCDAATKWTII